MRRAVLGLGLLMALGGLALLGAHLWLHADASPAHIYAPAGLSAFGLIVAALMADPKNVLAFAKSLAAFKWGKREPDGDVEGESGTDSPRSE